MAVAAHLQKPLKQAFTQLQKAVNDFRETLSQMDGPIASACALTQRLNIVANATPATLGALAGMPGIRERLLEKHVEQLEAILKALNACQSSLDASLEEAESAANAGFEAVRSAGEVVPVQELVTATATGPAIATALAWLDTAIATLTRERERVRRFVSALTLAIKEGSLSSSSSSSSVAAVGSADKKQTTSSAGEISLEAWKIGSVLDVAKLQDMFTVMLAGKPPPSEVNPASLLMPSGSAASNERDGAKDKTAKKTPGKKR